MDKSSQGSWLDTDISESADAKTDYKTSRVAMLIGTGGQMLESSIKEAFLKKVHIIFISSSSFLNHIIILANLNRHTCTGSLANLVSIWYVLIYDSCAMTESGNFV